MNKYFVLIFFLCFHFLFSQNELPIVIEGIVIDKNSSETLPLANIIINDASGEMISGTTANTFGEFQFLLSPNNSKITIIVSYIYFFRFH